MEITTPKNGSIPLDYTYNTLRQLTEKASSIDGKDFARSYSYEATALSNQKTNRISEAKYTFDGTVKLGYTYKYDAMDRITEVRKSSSPNSKYLEYEYDKMGQLTSATDHAAGLEYTYTFDTAGNVLSAVTHPTSGGSDSTRIYHYDNASWRDLLTSITINGTTKEIKYPKDSSGNVKAGTPLSWYNGSEFTLDWTNGTQLASAKKGLALKTSYTYDMAGVRSSKTVGTTKYSFTTLSGLVMRQEWGARQMDFVYDENNQPYALTYKSGSKAPVMYYYLLNQQGDVEALMDANGAIVATYEYDPWGAVTVKNANGALDNDDTSIGNMNPLRYRGYYYDNETGFYYLESRYYDPVVGRFISADTFATTDCNDFLSTNMFAYCENNPVVRADYTGRWTVAIGIGGNGAFGFGGAFSRQIVIDGKGNIGIIQTLSLQAGTPNAGAARTYSFSNADSIYDLEGSGYSAGGSAGAPVSIGIDVGYSTSPVTQKSIVSTTISVGASFAPAELHVNFLGNSKIVSSFNLFSFFRGLFGSRSKKLLGLRISPLSRIRFTMSRSFVRRR